MMTTCIQIIAFTIQPGELTNFQETKARIASEARELPGLLSSTTLNSLENEGEFLDAMIWESREAAIAGGAAFKQLPSTPEFLRMMKGPPRFAGIFTWSAGDHILKLLGAKEVEGRGL